MVPVRMRKLMWFLDEQVCASKNDAWLVCSQGVENVHILCAGKPDFDDRGTYVKRANELLLLSLSSVK